MSAYDLTPDPVQLLKSISCYEYQTCEHPEFEKSEAFAFVKSLEGAAIAALPGYEDAEWGAPSRKGTLSEIENYIGRKGEAAFDAV